MGMLGWVVGGTLCGLLLAVAAGVFSGWFGIIRIRKELLPARLPAMVNIWRKLTWRQFFEANQRAQNGKPLDRPYGAIGAVFNWERLQFKPVYLSRLPLPDAAAVDTAVELGPLAAKPLRLKIPILIGGMAYGSGYSLRAKVALAKAASLAGTAANTGNGPFLIEERTYADRLIIQYTRGFWSKAERILQKADLIEIALGHSARGSAPVRINGKKITSEVAQRYGTLSGIEVLMASSLPEVKDMAGWRNLIRSLKEVGGGVPIAVKFGASHYLEREMERFIEGGADVLAFDGLEGGTHGGMSVFMDDMGLPIFPALCRAVRYLREQQLHHKISLIVGGGLAKPGDFAKCLALGADAVLVGTITALSMSHTQTAKAVPWEPPTGLLYNDGKEKDKYDFDMGAQHLYHYFQSCVREMQLLARTAGKSRLGDLTQSDLVALDPLYARIAGIEESSGG
ncbi:glutamate synthase-like protein [Hydrogenispora ethanolica]|uniref:Glutamate synthase-like protein n=2 Tax=Hydrogenispora ethanolica TaxID=1082276 RepID=A0A4R1S009_HYDET|nr:glutamate synthase-like protein [Hydrogenispora ethanolica]